MLVELKQCEPFGNSLVRSRKDLKHCWDDDTATFSPGYYFILHYFRKYDIVMTLKGQFIFFYFFLSAANYECSETQSISVADSSEVMSQMHKAFQSALTSLWILHTSPFYQSLTFSIEPVQMAFP